MYSVSFFSKNLNRLLWSSSDTSASANFFSSTIRLQIKINVNTHKYHISNFTTQLVKTTQKLLNILVHHKAY
uniref:Uncharacterized protein n=1 Tax=Rhizophora mucronata TaxID=61149 RepID=A0A2P2IKI9_RHIMU